VFSIDVLSLAWARTHARASTNSAHADMDGADALPDGWERVDPHDMTWEQRERVLRLLLMRVNAAPPRCARVLNMPLPCRTLICHLRCPSLTAGRRASHQPRPMPHPL
jgi:hypothetical protein